MSDVSGAPSRSRASRWVHDRLEGATPAVFMLYAVVTAFTTYFCMYSFRKPFAAGTYQGYEWWIFDLKNALIISQLIGYALSKFLGIKFNSELEKRRRLKTLVLLILWAEAALLLFAVVPPPLKIGAIFLNGLPLGAVWGIVFSFLEGRRSSEILGAGLSCSYIIASGYVKTAGKEIMASGVSEFYMPVATGALFLPLFVVAAYGLSLLPEPSERDMAERTEREPMHVSERHAFLRSYWPGLVLLMVVYLFQTSYRDFRDNYVANIWLELGRAEDSMVYTSTEIPIAFSVMAMLALLYLVRNNRRGLAAAYGIMIAGAVLIAVGTALFDAKAIDPDTWMTLVGLGLYMGYVPFGCVLFDRTIAALRTVATAVFLIYVSDAVAYGGSVVTVIYKQLGEPSMSFLDFFRGFSYLTAFVTGGCLLVSCLYFLRKAPRESGADSRP